MADIALDADALRRDRQRYQALLEVAEQQIAAWNERADHLQQAVDGLDRLLALSADDPARDGGAPQGGAPDSGASQVPDPPPPTPIPLPAAADTPPPRPRRRKERPEKKPSRAPAAKASPPATATPAAPDPVEPPAASAAEAPKGTDALRMVFESDPERAWSLAELIVALGARGWLSTSRRPEEGARISLKRLAERGVAARTDDGRWQLARPGTPAAEVDAAGSWPRSEPPPAPAAPAAQAAPAAEEPNPAPPPPPVGSPPAEPAPPPLAAGRPVGGSVTEL